VRLFDELIERLAPPFVEAHLQVRLRALAVLVDRDDGVFGVSLPSGERITVRKSPPGRRSMSHSTVVHGRGQNHFIKISGVVHARHTRSGDRSTTRSRTRSGSSG